MAPRSLYNSSHQAAVPGRCQPRPPRDLPGARSHTHSPLQCVRGMLFDIQKAGVTNCKPVTCNGPEQQGSPSRLFCIHRSSMWIHKGTDLLAP
jgi:hypothetical protein